ncbi:hypothetical protein DDZ14_02205 [Maritimibacter sp. 55A14]|nr:hypothetical protein DDZ14_02205 [Maritimibacter sp. 55A14]
MLAAAAVVGVLLFIIISGVGRTTVTHPGGAGAPPVTLPVDPAAETTAPATNELGMSGTDGLGAGTLGTATEQNQATGGQ